MSRKLTFTALAIFLGNLCTYCQEAASAAQNATEKTAGQAAPILKDIFSKGGWIMYVILGISVIGTALIIYSWLTTRDAVLAPAKFIAAARSLAAKNDFEALRNLCRGNGSSAAKIIGDTIEETVLAPKSKGLGQASQVLEDAGARQASIHWQNIQYVMDIAVLAPMVGLLGTVWGMMVSFGGIENGEEFAKKAETLANGISQAMYTTFGGLVVGIIAMLFYDVLKGRLTHKINGLETACNSVINQMKE